MNIKDIALGSGGALIVLLTLIQISPIKIDPWSAMISWIGKQANKETNDKLDALQKDMDSIRSDLASLKEEDARKEALTCRYRILRFADECYLGQKHSHEHFKQILQDITIYEAYCTDHPEFPNQVAVIAIEQIKKIYQKTCENHSFLI